MLKKLISTLSILLLAVLFMPLMAQTDSTGVTGTWSGSPFSVEDVIAFLQGNYINLITIGLSTLLMYLSPKIPFLNKISKSWIRAIVVCSVVAVTFIVLKKEALTYDFISVILVSLTGNLALSAQIHNLLKFLFSFLGIDISGSALMETAITNSTAQSQK